MANSSLAPTRTFLLRISKGASYFADFNLVIASQHPYSQLNQLSEILWSDATLPHLSRRTFGWLPRQNSPYNITNTRVSTARHNISYTNLVCRLVIESHPEMPPSLRLDKHIPRTIRARSEPRFRKYGCHRPRSYPVCRDPRPSHGRLEVEGTYLMDRSKGPMFTHHRTKGIRPRPPRKGRLQKAHLANEEEIRRGEFR